MSLSGLVHLMRQSKEVGNLHTALSNKNTPLITGLTGSQKSLYIAALASKSRTTVVITHNHAQASRIAQDIQTFTKEYPVYCFDPPELMPYEEAAFSLDLRMNRLEVLINARNPGSIVIIPVQAAMEGLISPEEFYKHKVTMDYDSRIDIENFSEKLVVMGYERTAMVEKFGQFSVRGGIIDIYPFSEAHPVRIELFDDEVDSIRHFDINTQLTIENISEVTIYPARETIITNKDLDAIKTMIWDQAQEYSLKLHNLKKPESADKLLEKVATHLEKIDQGGFFDGIEQYKPMFSKISNILEYFSEDALIIFDEPTRLRENSINYLRDIAETITVALEQGKTLPVINKLYFDWHQIVNTRKNNPIMYFSVLGKRTQGITGNLVEYPVNSRAPEHFQGNVERFVKKVKQWRKDYNRLLFVVGTKERAERLVEYLGEEEITASLVVELTTEIKAGNCVVVVGNLETGFEFPSFKLITLTDLEIYGKQRAKHRVSRIEDGIKLSQDELKIGDYVVHINHGIGQYLGVETLEVAGVHKDYLVVKYAKEDKLYVPTDQIHLLQKYVGFDEQAPRLSRLGGSEWTRVKSRVKESVKEMAEGLLKLYAEREAIHGYAYSEDTVWQREFEDAFPYQETDDQLRAIEEVKRDMQKPRPMDRLLCGDVGYGKTEVAIRAAFKAVSEGKQVAVLVPTTILAQQHHRTFTERFENYPVNVGVLSRFQSQSEITKVLEGLAKGTVDIVIGTHRLLSNDIRFKDIGLVIVDEEQRFGVAQKEKLKVIAKNVDVITLSATPIPRTLHMAMVGVRDMSIIETPPEDRFPIRTYVVEYDEQLIRQAILRELAREGQVYFVYNRVQTIEKMYQELSELVPEARIAIAHGQMNETQLEKVMLDFYQGEFDILLCTTIIETGMDISNVNTLIIYDADYLGLAQLYQLRGRVGRTNRIAYAYFTYRKDKILSEDAEKRLQAIKEFTDLGSGIKIAMRDLEIRGAGNLLGPEQHGFISSVGFELYCRLLEESVRELKGEIEQKPPEPVIDLNVDAYISDEYVPDSTQKIELYKRVMAIQSLEEADDVEEIFLDRFGLLPKSVQNLVNIARIKVLARKIGVATITNFKEFFIIKMLEGLSFDQQVISNVIRKYKGKVFFQHGRSVQIKLNVRNHSGLSALNFLYEVVSDIWEGSWGK